MDRVAPMTSDCKKNSNNSNDNNDNNNNNNNNNNSKSNSNNSNSNNNFIRNTTDASDDKFSDSSFIFDAGASRRRSGDSNSSSLGSSNSSNSNSISSNSISNRSSSNSNSNSSNSRSGSHSEKGSGLSGASLRQTRWLRQLRCGVRRKRTSRSQNLLLSGFLLCQSFVFVVNGSETCESIKAATVAAIDGEIPTTTMMIGCAARSGDLSTLNQLLQKGAQDEADSNGWRPVHEAAMKGHVPVLELLIEAKALISAQDNHDRTPLHWSVLGGHVETVGLLLESKASPHATDRSLMTPLHACAVHGHVEIAQLLLDAGADVAAEDGWQQTLLHQVVPIGMAPLVRHLLDRRAPIDGADADGGSPLSYAIKMAQASKAGSGSVLNAFLEAEPNLAEELMR